ncbi:MAG TPA: hypothetical protein VLC10_02730 [Patescibacteria group bacterium]|nr:hypothetical protein [Patescibacteria group bacterium]
MNDGTRTAAPARALNAMAFFDGRDYVRPASLARAFAGDDGRIATLPDIVAARLEAPSTDMSWDRFFTTSTAEYVGLSPAGAPIIVVAHGIGPLADVDGVVRTCADGRDEHGHGRIPREEFLKIADGAYGDVAIVELRELYRLRRHPLLEMLTYDQACEDPLVRARLGEDAEAFLARHRLASRRWLREKDYGTRGNDCVLSLQDSARCGYGGMTLDDGWARAHLIDVSPLTDYGHCHWNGPDWHRSLVTELSCHAWGTRTGAIGIRGAGPITGIHPGPEIARDGFARLWRTLVQPTAVSYRKTHLHPLTSFGGLWFTRYEGTGTGPDDGQPAHPVRQVEGAGHVVDLRMPILDEDDLRKVALDARRIRDEAMPWANAYRILAPPRAVWTGDRATHHVVRIEYCVADIDTTRRVPPMHVLERQFDFLMGLPQEAP